MGLTLHLLRHAKSSWDAPGQSDHDRPLNARGRRAGKAMGRFLAREGPLPTRVLCSSALRARETWERVRRGLGDTGAPEVEHERRLYQAGASEMLERLRAVADGDGCVLLVAHHPGTANLALTLAGSGDEAGRSRMREKYPTAGLATLRFEIASWAQLEPGSGVLVRFVVPRELG